MNIYALPRVAFMHKIKSVAQTRYFTTHEIMTHARPCVKIVNPPSVGVHADIVQCSHYVMIHNRL